MSASIAILIQRFVCCRVQPGGSGRLAFVSLNEVSKCAGKTGGFSAGEVLPDGHEFLQAASDVADRHVDKLLEVEEDAD